jgi:hypothetical protein
MALASNLIEEVSENDRGVGCGEWAAFGYAKWPGASQRNNLTVTIPIVY